MRADLDESAVLRERLDDLLGDRTPGELALVARLVDGFEAKARGLLLEAVGAAARHDPDAAVLHVHRLRGWAATLGAVRLAQLCAEVEGQAAAGRSGPVLERRSALDDAVAGFVTLLAAEHDGLVTPAGTPARPSPGRPPRAG